MRKGGGKERRFEKGEQCDGLQPLNKSRGGNFGEKDTCSTDDRKLCGE